MLKYVTYYVKNMLNIYYNKQKSLLASRKLTGKGCNQSCLP